MNDDNSFDYAKTPLDFLKFNILVKREEVLDALRRNNEFKLNGAQPPNGILVARIRSLYFCVRATIKRNLCKKDFDVLEVLNKSVKINDYMELWFFLEDYLDKLKVTRFDLYESYDTTRVENENKKRGM